jgi:acetyl esterase/lipase
MFSLRRLHVCQLALAAALAFTSIATAATPPKVAGAAVLEDRYPERRIAFAGGVTGLADVVYYTPPGSRPATLDLYMPPVSKRIASGQPLVIYIHGGGWSGGHTRHSGAFENWPGVLTSLAARGFVVSSLSYRLLGEAPFPAAIQDVKAAIKFLRANASRYGIDKSRVLVWGGSAGGHLTALAATTCGVAALEPVVTGALAAESDCVQAAVTWYGIFDLTTQFAAAANMATSPIGKYFGCTAAGCGAEALKFGSPQSYLNAQTPRFLMIHGKDDSVVPVAQSEAFHKAMQAAGLPSELLVIPDVNHSFVGKTQPITEAASLQALDRSFEFIADALGINNGSGSNQALKSQ